MRIGIAIECADPTVGGAERSTAQIASILAERGHEVTLVTGYSEPEFEVPGVKTLALCWWRSSRVTRLLRFSRFAASMISGLVSPNLASSPEELAHLPSPMVESLIRKPMRGTTPSFLEIWMIRATSLSCSTTK